MHRMIDAYGSEDAGGDLDGDAGCNCSCIRDLGVSPIDQAMKGGESGIGCFVAGSHHKLSLRGKPFEGRGKIGQWKDGRVFMISLGGIH